MWNKGKQGGIKHRAYPQELVSNMETEETQRGAQSGFVAVASVGWSVLSCTPKGWGLDYWLGHTPRLSGLIPGWGSGHLWEATN